MNNDNLVTMLGPIGVAEALRFTSRESRMIVCVKADGSVEYGPGITQENVWREIAKAILPPAP